MVPGVRHAHGRRRESAARSRAGFSDALDDGSLRHDAPDPPEPPNIARPPALADGPLVLVDCTPRLRGTDSAPALGLHEGNSKRQKGRDGGRQRKKGAPRPAECGRLEQEAQGNESEVDPCKQDQELILGDTA